MSANARSRIGGTGEGNDVFFTDMVEQFPGGATNKGNRSRRQDCGFDDILHHFVRHPGRWRSWLHQHRDSREKRRGSLFAKAPSREIKRVDENRCAFRGNEKMLACEYSGL